jgi:type IV pilus assembly protein PilE
MRNSGQSGFTLLELMVTTAIVAVLAAITLPSYQEAVRKGRRAEAKVALLELMQAQERYATQANCYLAFTTTAAGVSSPGASCPGSSVTTVPFKNFSGDNRATAHYLLSASVCTGLLIQDCVVVSATPLHADPLAGTLMLSSFGEKSCSGSDPARCWR